METSVETISERDWSDIAAIVSAHRGYPVTAEEFCKESLCEELREESHEESFPVYFLCRRDGKVIGTARVYKESTGVYVNGLFVHSEYRRCGVAREIILAILSRWGHRRMRLHVDTRLTWLVQFYQKVGFVLQEGIPLPSFPFIRCMIR